MQFLPTEEIYQDYENAKNNFFNEVYGRDESGAFVIVEPFKRVKERIGQKYGLPIAECSKINNIIRAILLYLRKIRITKSEFTKKDIEDFHLLTQSESRYEKLCSYLDQESGVFVKFLLDHLYDYLKSHKVKQYTIDNIDKIKKSEYQYILAGTGVSSSKLEEYKNVKQYYDEHYGQGVETHNNKEALRNELQVKLIEGTYEHRLQLEQHLQDFILHCYDFYKKNSSEYVKICKLIDYYQDKIHELYPHYIPHHVASPEETLYGGYKNALSVLRHAYIYLSKNVPEQNIEKSIEIFNQSFDNIIYKNIIGLLVKNDASDIDISELKEADFGYYFTIDSNWKTLYVNFVLKDEYNDISDLDELVRQSKNTDNHINFVDYQYINYIMKVTLKPLNKKSVNEGFDFNNNQVI